MLCRQYCQLHKCRYWQYALTVAIALLLSCIIFSLHLKVNGKFSLTPVIHDIQYNDDDEVPQVSTQFTGLKLSTGDNKLDSRFRAQRSRSMEYGFDTSDQKEESSVEGMVLVARKEPDYEGIIPYDVLLAISNKETKEASGKLASHRSDAHLEKKVTIEIGKTTSITKVKVEKEANQQEHPNSAGIQKGQVPFQITAANSTPVYIGNGSTTILMWTVLSRSKPHWSFTEWMVDHCPYRCHITDDRRHLNRSSLVLFRLSMLNFGEITSKPLKSGTFIYPIEELKLPQRKYPNQVWVDANQESPMYSHSDEELIHVDKLFDYIVSYHSQSDYSISYIPSILPKSRQKPVNYAQNKSKMALWYVSHCDALSGRDAYIEELKKNGIQVDEFGGCSKRSDGCQGHKDYDCIRKFRSQYKFYLAVENSICTEYITEKFWLTLNSTSYNIPIALGANLSEYKKYSPPSSYLHVDNFTSPAKLAQYMKSIDEDDGLFNSYHSWREQYYLSEAPREKLECWLCRMAHEQPLRKHNSYSKYWSRRNFCKTSPVLQ